MRVRTAAAVDWDDVFTCAALDPALWLDALGSIADATGSSHGQLIGLGSERSIPFNLVSGFPADEIARSVQMGADRAAESYRIAAADAQIACGEYDAVVHEEHYDAVLPGLQSRRYVDFCAEADIPFGCQTNLVLDQHGMIGFAILRSRSDGRSTGEQRREFARAARAARRAVRLQERLEQQQARMLAGAFDAMSITAFILDERGRVTAMSHGAEELARMGKVRLAGGRLQAAASPMSLDRCVSALVAPDGLANVRCRLLQAEGEPPVFLEGFRLPASSWHCGKAPHAVVLSRRRSGDRAGIAGFLTALYGLTAAEATIALRLLDGHSRCDIAASRQVTDDTLRGQIKSLLAKTGVANEAALMRLLLAITE